MQVYVSCMQCAMSGDWDMIQGSPGGWASVTSLAVNTWTCPEGHLNRFFLTEPFYQQLFEEAVWDLALRDTREAVLAFYSAWDNFVAHTVDILLTEFGVTVPMPKSTKRAEPRHGAFVALILAKANASPALPTNSTAMMRNSVIHDDKMPSEEEAFNVGEDVQRCILECQAALPGLHEEYGQGAKSVARRQRLFEAAHISPADLVGVSQAMRVSQIAASIRARVASIRAERPPSPVRDEKLAR